MRCIRRASLKRAKALFQDAERLQAERQPNYPRLYSLQGYQYCDLLLEPRPPRRGLRPGGADA